MDNKLHDFKVDLINSGVVRHQTQDEYRCNCPYCGDRKRHCYIMIRLSDDSPVLYNCFKCNSKGVVNQHFLELLGLDNLKTPQFKLSKKLEVQSTASTKIDLNKQLVSDDDSLFDIQNYILNRIGHTPSIDQLKEFQYVSNPKQYAIDYLGYKGDNDRIFDHRFWFRLSNGNIHGRLDHDGTRRWQRFQTNRVSGSAVYTIKNGIDLYEPIVICVCEGIMDAIGLYFNYECSNSVYVATLGKNYVRGIQYVMNMGIFGNSVSVRIFKDPDVKPEKIFIDKGLMSLFKRIDVYENTMGADYGVKEDQMDIKKVIMKRG